MNINENKYNNVSVEPPSGFHLECDFEHNYRWVPDALDIHKSSLEIAIENGEELIEYFKDKWDDETLKKHLYLQELAEYNLSLWEDK